MYLSDPKTVSEEEYKAFYKVAFKDSSNSEALLHAHFKVRMHLLVQSVIKPN